MYVIVHKAEREREKEKEREREGEREKGREGERERGREGERERERQCWVRIFERLRMSKCQVKNIGTKVILSVTRLFIF